MSYSRLTPGSTSPEYPSFLGSSQIKARRFMSGSETRNMLRPLSPGVFEFTLTTPNSIPLKPLPASRGRAALLGPAVALLLQLQGQLLAARLDDPPGVQDVDPVGNDVVEQPLVVRDDE